MGGIATKQVYCDEFLSGYSVDSAIEEYIYKGLYAQANELTNIGWLPYANYAWLESTRTYVRTIDDIIVCSTSNGVTDSRYANTDYITNKWIPFQNAM